MIWPAPNSQSNLGMVWLEHSPCVLSGWIWQHVPSAERVTRKRVHKNSAKIQAIRSPGFGPPQVSTECWICFFSPISSLCLTQRSAQKLGLKATGASDSASVCLSDPVPSTKGFKRQFSISRQIYCFSNEPPFHCVLRCAKISNRKNIQPCALSALKPSPVHKSRYERK